MQVQTVPYPRMIGRRQDRQVPRWIGTVGLLQWERATDHQFGRVR